MKIQIKATNIELNEPLKIWVDEKLFELKKLLTPFEPEDKAKRALTEVFVEIGRTSRRHNKGDVYRAEAQIQLPKKLLRAVSINVDLRTAIVETRDELAREIRRYKGKKETRTKKWARVVKEKFLR